MIYEDYFEKDYIATMGGTDYFGRLKPSALMMFLENVAVEHVSGLGFGWDYTTRELNAAWIIVRTRVALKRPPLYGETLRLRTWAATPKNAYFPRETEIFAEDGSIGEASAVWVLADVDTRKILPPARFYELTGFRHRGDPRFEAPARISTALEYRNAESFAVRYSDLDMNRHVHNTRYIDMAEDHLAVEREPDLWVKGINIGYAAETREGETLVISDAVEGLRRFVRGTDPNGKKKFDLELVFDRI